MTALDACTTHRTHLPCPNPTTLLLPSLPPLDPAPSSFSSPCCSGSLLEPSALVLSPSSLLLVLLLSSALPLLLLSPPLFSLPSLAPCCWVCGCVLLMCCWLVRDGEWCPSTLRTRASSDCFNVS